MAHGDDSLVAYEMIYGELKSALTIESAHKPFTEPQQRTVGYGERIMAGSQNRLKGDPEALLGIIRELSEGEHSPRLCPYLYTTSKHLCFGMIFQLSS